MGTRYTWEAARVRRELAYAQIKSVAQYLLVDSDMTIVKAHNMMDALVREAMHEIEFAPRVVSHLEVETQLITRAGPDKVIEETLPMSKKELDG